MILYSAFSDAFDCWFAFLQLSSPEVPLVVLFIDHATETAFVQQGKNLRKIASGVAKHLRLLAATKHLPDASVCFMSISESRVHLFPFELGWDGRHFEQPRVFNWHVRLRGLRQICSASDNKRDISHLLRNLKIEGEDIYFN